MPLKLRVISDHYKHLGKAGSQLFGVHGGLIGRAADNDWVLPDPDRYISTHHAKVTFRAGAWILEDTSTNGVFVNDRDSPLSVTGPYKLKDGDRLRLGDYDIIVSIDDHNDFSPDASGQMPPPSQLRERRSVRPNKPPARPVAKHQAGLAHDVGEDFGEDLGEELDITGMFVAGVRQADTPADAVAAFDRDLVDKGIFGDAESNKPSRPTPDLMDDVLEVSLPRAPSLQDPDEAWHMSTRRLQQRKPNAPPPTVTAAPQPTPVPAPPMTTPTAREPERARRGSDGYGELHAGVEALCRGAGIDPAVLPNDAHTSLLTLAGQMLREVVLDLMEALRSRGDQKNRLHINQTMIQPMQNNPLKFSAGVDEALRKLLDSHSNRYLGPVEALREAFNDLKNHQLAMDAAMHTAVNDLLTRVDPAELQERFDRGQKRNPLLGAVSKGKYWELYTEFFPLLNQRDARGWPAVFTEEFTRAYGDKIDALESPKKK